MKPNIVPQIVWNSPIHFISFGFGSGAMPFAPGTFGTVMAIPFYLMVQNLPLFSYFLFLILITAVGIWLCGESCKAIGVHDHPGIVFDEFVGYFVTMLGAPKGWGWVLLGFILFRIFDIWKPQPIRWMDRHLKGGVGVVMDDVAAGIIAMILLQVIALVLR